MQNFDSHSSCFVSCSGWNHYKHCVSLGLGCGGYTFWLCCGCLCTQGHAGRLEKYESGVCEAHLHDQGSPLVIVAVVRGGTESWRLLSSSGYVTFWIFCLPSTELGNTISSLFGGGGPTPETGENLTDSVQVSPRVTATGRKPFCLAVAIM